MGGSRRARCNHTARRQRRSLVLGVLLELLQRASMAAGATFASRTELRTACNAWCADAASAAIEYGPIGDWDVSQVDDLHQLFRGCSSFNENINGWDVSRVTSLSARDRARSALAWPRFTCPPPLPYLATLLVLDDCALYVWICIAPPRLGRAHAAPPRSLTLQRSWPWMTVQFTFHSASTFNQPLESWNVARVINLLARDRARSAFSSRPRARAAFAYISPSCSPSPCRSFASDHFVGHVLLRICI